MKIPTIEGIIRRRILLNYRATPDVVRDLLPANFSPKLVDGQAIVGVCLIRLEQIRPKGLPTALGIQSENSAHRFAVTWEDDDGQLREGVYVSRRDTDSRLNALTGSRLFPGVHHLGRFRTTDADGHISIRIETAGPAAPLLDLRVRETDRFPFNSVFQSLEHASQFFESGCIGYSSRPQDCTLDGLRLHVPAWIVQPLEVERAESAFFGDPDQFPPGHIKLDHALLMRDIKHEWHAEPAMTAELVS